mmetsp:Transcript_9323/g.34501  ORF Transcript_9323/g.34501 Transcript_9323/m.34501 type:complete len:246 (+) Transcript_9323:1938-2675(+)
MACARVQETQSAMPPQLPFLGHSLVPLIHISRSRQRGKEAADAFLSREDILQSFECQLAECVNQTPRFLIRPCISMHRFRSKMPPFLTTFPQSYTLKLFCQDCSRPRDCKLEVSIRLLEHRRCSATSRTQRIQVRESTRFTCDIVKIVDRLTIQFCVLRRCGVLPLLSPNSARSSTSSTLSHKRRSASGASNRRADAETGEFLGFSLQFVDRSAARQPRGRMDHFQIRESFSCMTREEIGFWARE